MTTAMQANAPTQSDGYVGRYNADGLRWCSGGCGYVDVALFQRNRAQADGYSEYCRLCRRAQRRAYYARNREREIAAAREWQAAHPERARAAGRRANRAFQMRLRLETGVYTRKAARQAKRDQAQRILRTQPNITSAALARMLGWSESNARRWLRAARDGMKREEQAG